MGTLWTSGNFGQPQPGGPPRVLISWKQERRVAIVVPWFWRVSSAAFGSVLSGHQGISTNPVRSSAAGGSWRYPTQPTSEMVLPRVFFILAKTVCLDGARWCVENLLPKDHTHLFVNKGGTCGSWHFGF